MALVRISVQLKGDVKANVRKLADNARRVTIEPKRFEKDPDVVAFFSDYAERTRWGEHAHLKSSLPADWLGSTDRLDIRLVNETGSSKTPEFNIHNKVILPPTSGKSTYIDISVPATEVPPEVLAKVDGYFAAVREHNEKFNRVEAQIFSFLKASKSLNDALKRYPDLSLYIPQSYLNHIERKVDRTAAAKPEEQAEPDIDRSLVTSLGVLGTMTTPDKD